MKVALRRVEASGYGEAGASFERRALRAFNPNSGSPTEDILPHLDTLRKRSRLLYMAAPIATAAIKTNRTHVIGPGLVMQSSIDIEALSMSPEDAQAWQKKTNAEFRLWANKARNCDAIGMNTFAEMQQLALVSTLLGGDCFAILRHEKPSRMNPYGLRIYLTEADRISTPDKWRGFGNAAEIPQGQTGAGNRIFDGIEVNAGGKVIAYHVASDYPGNVLESGKELKWARVKAVGDKTGLPNILQIMVPERCDQYRGVPLLAPVIESILQTRRYNDAELMAAIVKAMFTAWIESEEDATKFPLNQVDKEAKDVPLGENDYAMNPGTVVTLPPGKRIVFGNPNVTNAGFESFTNALCEIIGAAIGVPKDVLLMKFNSSYSASRGALMEAWETFKTLRSCFVSDFCQEVYEVWLTEAVARGRIIAPGFFTDPAIRQAWCGARWVGPTQVSLDPVKDTKAASMQVSMAVKTHGQVTQELGGGDWNDNVVQVGNELRQMQEAGLAPAAEPSEDGTPPEPEDNDNDEEGGEDNARNEE